MIPASCRSGIGAKWISRSRSLRASWAPWRTRDVGRDLRPLAELIRSGAPRWSSSNIRRLAKRRSHHLEEAARAELRPSHLAVSRDSFVLDSEGRLKRATASRGGRDGVARAGNRTSAQSTGLARSARRARSRWRCSASGARATGWARSPKAACSRRTRDELIECAALVVGDPVGELGRAADARGAARYPGPADRRGRGLGGVHRG